MKVEIKISDAHYPNTKMLEMQLWDGVSECSKRMRYEFVKDIIPENLLKTHLKEKIMELIGDELEKYIDGALE